jgi:hypothetical protein
MVLPFFVSNEKSLYVWSIAVLRGETPFAWNLTSAEIVLSASDVDDVPAWFVADPFMLRRGRLWYMLFEVLNGVSGLGEIAYATSVDGTSWRYRGVVLREPFHLSYPLVFRWNGDYWMIPETLKANAIRLYRAEHFPDRWKHVDDLVPLHGADPTVFRYRGRWWMFVCPTPRTHETLVLYHADELTGPWREHPRNPIVAADNRRARPAGRVVVSGGRLYRFAQDCAGHYGTAVRAFEITELTTTTYRERERGESPILRASGHGWNRDGMHHIDPHRLPGGGWIACVDGNESAS